MSDPVIASLSAKTRFSTKDDKFAVVVCARDSNDVEFATYHPLFRSVIDAISADPRFTLVVLFVSEDPVVDLSQASAKHIGKDSPLQKHARRSRAILDQFKWAPRESGRHVCVFTADEISPDKALESASDYVSMFALITKRSIPMVVSIESKGCDVIRESFIGDKLTTLLQLFHESSASCGLVSRIRLAAASCRDSPAASPP